MTSYLFQAFGKTKAFSAATAREAMVQANKKFPLGAGVWMKSADNSYRWVVGNFCD